ncbi:MAG TPA: LamG-like jellyroll fold domain-containing protein [Candidatus Dormibacteraeota bacterium]|nr:LamG-like jellyroll fold domain-containing protein [Candidatus Dormibacteraeota bacterium]
MANLRPASIPSLAPTATYASTVLGDHPQLYYRLDDSGCCVAVDASGNGLNGTYGASSVTYGTAGLIAGDTNTAITNNGTATALTRDPSALPSTGARTVELWIQTTNTSWQTLYSYGASNVNGGFFELSIRPDNRGTVLLFLGVNDDAAFYTPYTIDDGRPHQIDLSYNGTALLTFYVDGQQTGQATLAAPLATVLTSSALALGNGLDGAFRGVLDEFAIYPTALTPDQINSHWQAGTAASACPAAPTTGYAGAVAADHPYRYFRLGDAGQAVTDYSGNCRYAAYGNGVPRVPGLLTGDADGAIGSPSAPNTMLGASVDGSPSSGARTVELWAQTTNTSWQTLFSYGASNVNGGFFQLSIRPDARGTLLFFTGVSNDAATYTPYPIDDGQPHQIDLSYDGSALLTFYVDGQQAGQIRLSAPLATVLTAQALVLGTGLDPAFNGVLDELAVYPAALTPDQVNRHWRAGTAASACPVAPTTGYAAAVVADHPSRYFRLGDTGQAATDYSGNCRYAAYASGVPRVPGLLVADPDGAIGTPSPSRTVLSASTDGSPSSGARTLEFWEQTTNTSWQTLLSYGAIGVNGGFFQLSIRPDVHGTVLQFIGWNDDAGFYTPYLINDGYPHQIALSYDGSAVLTFFVDGQQIGQTSLATPLNTVLGGQPLELSSGLDPTFNGVLDELSLYPAALNGAQVNAHYIAGAIPPGYSILGGTVLSGGSGLPGARPEACPTGGGTCFFALPSGPAGAFHVAVPNGSYTITVFPPLGSQFLSPLTFGPYTVPPSVTNVTITFGGGLPPTGTFSTPSGSTTGTVPTANWTQPSTYTVTGCVGGFGELLLQSFNTRTGKPETMQIALVETPVNSGTYVAHIPALAPLHGLTSVSQTILCAGHTSVLPNGGKPAGGTAVLLADTGLTGATGVLFGGTPAASFQVLNDNVIKAVSPPGTGTVTISVTTASGSTVVIGGYTYLEVSGISPSSGPSTGATVVTITGQGLTNVRGVIFGLLPATSFTVNSPTQITAVAPAGLGTIDIQVVSGFAVTEAVTASLYTYLNGPPGSSSINEGTGPTAIDVLSGEVLGSGFCDASKRAATTTNIDFGKMCEGAQTIVSNVGPTGILQGAFYTSLLVTPALAAIFFDVDAVILFALMDALLPFWPVLLLAIAIFVFWDMFIDPAGTVVDTTGNPIAGATATIEGQGSGGSFVPVAAASGSIIPATNPEATNATGAFEWDAIAGSYLIQASTTGCHAPGSGSQPTVSTPPFMLPPPVVGLILTMECPGSTAPAPTVSNLFPALGVSAGGTQVEISGTGLADNPNVRFGSTPAQSVTVLSPYAIVAIAPPGVSTVDVTVTTAGGTSATGAASKYGYYTPPARAGAPSITSVSPSSGPQAGGNLVKIFGAGLVGTFGVTFGNAPAVQITNVSAIEVDAIAPAGAGDGPVGIVVSSPSGVSAPTPAATYTYGSPPNRSTATNLSSSVNPSVYRTAITLTATVTPGGSGTPTGLVTFADSTASTTLGTGTLSTSAGVSTATLTINVLTVGSHSLTARYGGDNNFNPSSGDLTQVVNPGPLDHLVLTPASATITAGGSQSYTAKGFDQYNNDLGNVTSATTFTIAPDGSCTFASCTATVAGAHTVTGTDGSATGTASLTVNAAGLNHLVLSPASATIIAGGNQSYTAEGFDQYNNDLGNVTSATTFTVAPNGSCTHASCTATVAGAHTVTGTDGSATGTASLSVNAAGLNHLVLSPASATIIAGGRQSYTAEGFDQYNNDLGNVTSATTFTIAPDGSCTFASCTSPVTGAHTVTGTDGSASGTASLTVNSAVDLQLALSITPGLATTGTPVTASVSLINTASVSRTVTLTSAFSYVSPTGQHFTITGAKVTFTMAAGQTVARSFTFKVPSYVPRGTYSFSATASDVTGSVTSAATFIVT